jgi:hypothetical protein
MSTSYADGCRCARCWEGLPHEPIDEFAVLRALRHDPLIHGAPARRLRSYDAVPVVRIKRAQVAQPWVPRPARRASVEAERRWVSNPPHVRARIGEEPQIAVRLRPDSQPITLNLIKTRWPRDAASTSKGERDAPSSSNPG